MFGQKTNEKPKKTLCFTKSLSITKGLFIILFLCLMFEMSNSSKYHWDMIFITKIDSIFISD